MLPLYHYTPAPGGAVGVAPPAPAPSAPSPAGRPLTQEDTAEGTYVRTDLSADYANTPWPMLPPGGAPGTVEHFYRSFVQDRLSGVFVVYDRVIVRPPASLFRLRLDPRQGPLPSPPFVQGYFAPMGPGALGLEVRTLTPALPTSDGPGSVLVTASEDGQTLDAPFLTVLRYTDPAASELRTLLVRSRSGDPMTGARIQTGGAPRYVFFNARAGATPDPVVTTELPSEPGATWVLFGLKPGASYAVGIEGGSLVVNERAGAPHTASLSGVLQVGAAVQGENVPAFTYTLAESSPIRVALCDPNGKEVAVLAEGVHTPGTHALSLAGLAPGQYVVQVVAPGAVRTQRIAIPQ